MTNDGYHKRYVLSITGASGSIIGLRVLGEIIKNSEVHLIISASSIPIIKEETGLDLGEKAVERLVDYLVGKVAGKRKHILNSLFLHDDGNIWAPVSSGSFLTDGMLVVPCSMKTLSAIANGYSDTLTARAADVTMKEGRLLILSPRETPFSAIHLENMLKLSRLGVCIVPPVMGFYFRPRKIDDMVDFIAGKILDQIGVVHNLYRRWQ